ncbi:hypothetical protein HBI67_009440 [Parastagonospora nodorum]|nr:hypothetical protein HBI66_108400 [Parastagonospora nodorum]KAH6086138.1 hypothetical protein HBI67_009440 [Parastagonospora nodorum]
MSPFTSLPPAAQANNTNNNQTDDVVQRLKAMKTSATTASGPTPVRTPSKTLASLPEPTIAAATFPAKRAESIPEDTDSMSDTSVLSRQLSNTSDDSISSRRPTTPRSQTDPTLDISSYRPPPRNRSPYSRTHLRSHSSSASLSAPPMTRAHSLPTVMHGQLSLSPTPQPLASPSSPMRSPQRTRSPRGPEPRPLNVGPRSSGIRPASLGSFEGSPSVCDISEDAELELTPRAGTSVSTLYSSTGSLSRRRRPASPLHQVYVPFGASATSTPSVSTPTSAASSPLLAPAKFTNEHYPSSLASSSVPSTPTSMRSRSPSISSLETIEDSPDAEEEAIEADRIAKLKAAADREDGGDMRRSSLDIPDRGRTFGFGKRDSRKRWSVCGAERRGDLDLETIWED